MPIKGLPMILPRLGKIKLGTKKISKQGSEHPEETDYFILNPLEEIRDKAGNIKGTKENKNIKALIDIFGEDPDELRVVFPLDNEEMILSHYYKWWSGNVEKRKATMKCKGDGEFAFYRGKDLVSGIGSGIDFPEGMNRICNPKVCEQAQKQGNKPPLCKPNMNILFLVPEYTLAGSFQMSTSSIQAMSQIISCMVVSRNYLRTKGIHSIAGVPMRFYRKRTPNIHGGVNYIVQMELDEERLSIELEKLKKKKSTTLLLGTKYYDLQIDIPDDPEYDLLPKSRFPYAIQTGDPILIDEPKTEKEEDIHEKWIDDKEIMDKFDNLAKLKNTICTKQKMLATAKRFDTKENLVEYLDKMIAEEESKPE